MINVERLTGFLEAMGCLNQGRDHISLYAVEAVEFQNKSLKKTLRYHFEKHAPCGEGEKPVCGKWTITIETLDNGLEKLRELAHYYFFGLRFSPEIREENGNSPANVVAGFIDCFEECIDYQSRTFYSVRACSNEVSNAGIHETVLVKVENELCIIRFGFTD